MEKYYLKMVGMRSKLIFQMLFILIISITQVFAQNTSEPNKIQDAKEDALRLSKIIEEECKSLEIAFPIPAKELETSGAKIYVAEAIKNGITEFTQNDSEVLINDKTITVEMRLFNPSNSFNSSNEKGWWSAEAYTKAMKRYETKSKYLKDFKPVLEETIKQIFVEKLQLTYRIVEETSSGIKSIASEGSLSSRDIISDFSQKIDYRNIWNKIKKYLNDSKIGISKDNSDESKFTLNTSVKGSSDEEWLYQEFHTISLWDPYAQSEQQAGEYLSIEVVYVVKRRKQGGAWQRPAIRSGSDEDKLLYEMLNSIKTP